MSLIGRRRNACALSKRWKRAIAWALGLIVGGFCLGRCARAQGECVMARSRSRLSSAEARHWARAARKTGVWRKAAERADEELKGASRLARGHLAAWLGPGREAYTVEILPVIAARIGSSSTEREAYTVEILLWGGG
jgi:hypothetical protein